MNETTVVNTPKKGFFKDRPATLVVAAVLLLLLILAYAVLPMTGLERSFFRSGIQNFNRSQFPQGVNPGNFNGGQNFNPGQNYDQNNGSNNQNFSTTRRFNANSGINQVMRILTNILRWVVIGVGLLAAVGMWLKKRWGIVLGIILAVIAFASTVPSLFRPSFMAFTVILNIVILVLSVGVVVLSLLPHTRKATAPAV